MKKASARGVFYPMPRGFYKTHPFTGRTRVVKMGSRYVVFFAGASTRGRTKIIANVKDKKAAEKIARGRLV
jgi:predicted GH43/DUF377 family glycosyl hydrolase